MIDRIYIPTLGRPNEQVTWDNLPTELKKKVWFVIHEKEKDLYDYDAKYLVLDNNIGIANVRKEIVYHAGKIRFCMWDDDVIFYRRNRKYYGDLRINGEYVPDRVRENGKPISKWQMELEDFQDMFNQFNGWMDNEPKLIHIGHRRTNFSMPKSAIIPLKFNCKLDGIGGMVIGNVFKVQKDRLPKGYQGLDIAFVRQILMQWDELSHQLEMKDKREAGDFDELLNNKQKGE